MIIDNSTNIINGLFCIPDEGSFIKKLILANPTIFNPDILLAFKVLQEAYPDLQLIQKEHYFALLLPTISEGITLEAMLITTQKEDQRLLSIYHRIHFDQKLYPGMNIIESDTFLRLSAIVTNLPILERIEGLASLFNYQLKEAANIEITMLTLADANPKVVESNILPYIMNAVSRYMLACTLDDIAYERPQSKDVLSSLIARWCDLPLLTCAKGIEHVTDFKDDIIKTEDAFIAEFASATPCMMFLYLEQKTSSALLDKGGFKTLKRFMIDQAALFELTTIHGSANTLGKFHELQDPQTPPLDFNTFDPNKS